MKAGNKKGLSLIELMAAVAILLILATLVIPVGNMYVWREQEFELKDILSSFRLSIQNYYQEHNSYPLADKSGSYTSVIDKIENSLIKKGFMRKIPVNPFKNMRIKDLYSLWEIRNSKEDVWVTLNNAIHATDITNRSILAEKSIGPLDYANGASAKDAKGEIMMNWASSPRPIIVGISPSSVNIKDIIEDDAYRIDYVNGLVYANIGEFEDSSRVKYNLKNFRLTFKFRYNVKIFDLFNIRHSKNTDIQLPMFQLTPDDKYYTW